MLASTATQKIPAWIYVAMGYRDGFAFKIALPVAALLFAALATLGARWPRRARWAAFGASYVLVVCFLRLVGFLPTLSWAGTLAPLPLIAIAGGTLGRGVGRWVGRLTGDL
jgi:hypothetical protein